MDKSCLINTRNDNVFNFQTKIPYAYFGVFDGHAGCGAALMAVNNLHVHIMEKLHGVKELLAYENDEKLAAGEELSEAVISSVTIDSLVIGVLEEAFFEMVSLEASGDIYIACEQVLLCSRTKRNGEFEMNF